MLRVYYRRALELCRLSMPNVLTDYARESFEFMEWDAFASYLECWTGTFKSDPALKEIPEVVNNSSYTGIKLMCADYGNAEIIETLFCV